MTQSTQITQGDTTALGNTSNQSRARKWCLTLNNYTEEEYAHITQHFIDKEWLYIVGKEGDEKTPHLQIYIEAKNGIMFSSLKKLCNRFHIEKAKGTRKQNVEYCSKEGNFETNIPVEKEPIKDPLNGKTLRPFQEEVMRIISEEPDERKIYWFWDSEGNVGKTSLAKHICLKYPKKTLFLGGKSSDIKYGVKTFIDGKENDLKICIFHFTRSTENFISYEALESVKDGIFYNSKYESGMVIFNPPHIICFANFEPCEEKLSRDRWVVTEI